MDKARIAKAFGKVLSLVSIGFIIFSIFKLGLDFSFVNNLPLFITVVICGFILFIGLIVFFRKKITFFLANYKFHDFVKTLVIVMLLQIFILTMLGFVLVLLVLYAQGKTSLHIIETVLSTYILSWVLGYIVPGASGGIGIREMSLLLLLGPILGNSLVLSLSIVHRLITIVGDFLGYLIASIQYKRNIGNFSNV